MSTRLVKEDFQHILQDYHIGAYKRHKYIDWVLENDVYTFSTTNGKFILKVLSKTNIRSMKEQLELIDFLYAKGVPVVKNIKSRGKEIIKYRHKYLIIQKFVEGHHPKRFGNVLIKDMAKKIGKMHHILLHSKFTAKEKRHVYKKRKLGSVKNAVVQDIQHKLLVNLRKIKQDRLKHTQIHADLSEVNLLVKNNKLKAIIDWDDSTNDFIVQELAVFIAHAFVRGKKIHKDEITLFLREYQKVITLNTEERKALFYLITYRLIGILFWYLTYLKIHADKVHTLEKGIIRSVARLEQFNRLALDDFMSLC